jgi:hypothetical protein
MKQTTGFSLEEARPAASDVLGAQGLPDGDELAPRLRALLGEALLEFEVRAEPRAVWEELSLSAFGAALDGLDFPLAETVIGQIYPRADALALYAATLGEPLCARIRELFATNDLARAWMLDAVASVGADRLSDRLAERFRVELAGRGLTHARVLPYSPGYCGWNVRGQKRLFAALGPGDIGVTLNDSCLMSPIKSVSGVLVAGPKEIHRFRPDFPFCDECRTHACGRRMASVLRES